VDTPAPDAVTEDSLLAALVDAWAIAPDALRYVPKGMGSYHWVVLRDGRPTQFLTVDDLTSKPWIASDATTTFAGLSAAYGAAAALHDEHGLDFVVAPLPTVDGSVTHRLSARFSLAVCPFVAGTPGTWGQPIRTEARPALVDALARLHAAPTGALTGVGRRRHELPGRADLEAALAATDQPWSGGPYSEPARRALADNLASVHTALVRHDDLAGRLDGPGVGSVVTHGEPHPGNLIDTEAGLRLIDWDTIALAEPERDLWMLDDGTGTAFAEYAAQVDGRTIDADAIEYYRLAWTLSDIASFAAMFRAPHATTQWMDQKWNGYTALLGGAPSAPYGNTGVTRR